MEVVPILSFEGCETMVSYSRKRIHGNWIELRGKFCFTFITLPCIFALREEVLTFRHNEMESIGVVWVRFTLLVQSGSDLSLPDYMLLQHFYTGFDKESAHHLNITSG